MMRRDAICSRSSFFDWVGLGWVGLGWVVVARRLAQIHQQQKIDNCIAFKPTLYFWYQPLVK
jgi:hypothetical protein